MSSPKQLPDIEDAQDPTDAEPRRKLKVRKPRGGFGEQPKTLRLTNLPEDMVIRADQEAALARPALRRRCEWQDGELAQPWAFCHGIQNMRPAGPWLRGGTQVKPLTPEDTTLRPEHGSLGRYQTGSASCQITASGRRERRAAQALPGAHGDLSTPTDIPQDDIWEPWSAWSNKVNSEAVNTPRACSWCHTAASSGLTRVQRAKYSRSRIMSGAVGETPTRRQNGRGWSGKEPVTLIPKPSVENRMRWVRPKRFKLRGEPPSFLRSRQRCRYRRRC